MAWESSRLPSHNGPKENTQGVLIYPAIFSNSSSNPDMKSFSYNFLQLVNFREWYYQLVKWLTKSCPFEKKMMNTHQAIFENGCHCCQFNHVSNWTPPTDRSDLVPPTDPVTNQQQRIFWVSLQQMRTQRIFGGQEMVNRNHKWIKTLSCSTKICLSLSLNLNEGRSTTWMLRITVCFLNGLKLIQVEHLT